MNDYEKLEERCNYAEAKCQMLQEQLDEANALLLKYLPLEEPDE